MHGTNMKIRPYIQPDESSPQFPRDVFSQHFTFHDYVTPCSTVLLEKLTVPQPAKKFPAFYGTRRFITTFTSARHLSLSSATSIQSTFPLPTSLRSILILSCHPLLGLPSNWSFRDQNSSKSDLSIQTTCANCYRRCNAH